MTRLTDNWRRLGPQLPDGFELAPWTADICEELRPWLPGGEWKQWHEPQFEPLPERYVDGALYRLHREPWQRDRKSLVPRTLAMVADGQFIGTIGWIWRDYKAGWRRFDVCIYDPAHWGKGLGTMFCRAWTQWLLRLPDTHRLDFITWSGHTAMLRIGARLGFVEDARLLDTFIIRGQRVAEVVMSRISSDIVTWEKSSQT